MKVGIDLSFIDGRHKGEGIGSFIFHLLKGIQENGNLKNCCLFVKGSFFEEAKEIYSEAELIKIELDDFEKKVQALIGRVPKIRALNRFYNYKVLYNRLAIKHKCDVIYYPYNVALLSVLSGITTVITVHDLFYKHFPSHYSFKKRKLYENRYEYFMYKSDYIITISEYVKKDIIKHFPRIDHPNIEVIYNPVYVGDISAERPQIKGKYILSVNSGRKHKNLITLLKAFHKIASQIEHKLVLVGKLSGKDKTIGNYIQENKLNARIIMTGYVDDKTRDTLYSHADLFVSPSMHEGFGLTPIEAMMMELPTITTRETSLPEVTQGMAYYYEPADDHHALAERIIEVLDNRPGSKKLNEVKAHMAKMFNPAKIASAYWAAFETAHQISAK